jgi:recombination protein RecT
MMTMPAPLPKLHPLTQLHNQLKDRANEIGAALPAHITPQHFIRIVVTAVQKNLGLLTVDRRSLINACLQAAADGLLPDGREGVILPYKGQAQWQPMVAGLLKKFRNSGQFKSIATNVIRQGEEFSYFIDETGPHLRHVPGPSTAPPIGAYAVANTLDGGTLVKKMDLHEIGKRRAVSRAKDGPMWSDWWDEAAQKTVLRNLSKLLPTSAEIDEIMRRDDDPAAFHKPGEAVIDDLDQPDPTEQEAFSEGLRARRAGVARRAVPGPYRNAESAHLSRAWVAGWDSVESTGDPPVIEGANNEPESESSTPKEISP